MEKKVRLNERSVPGPPPVTKKTSPMYFILLLLLLLHLHGNLGDHHYHHHHLRSAKHIRELKSRIVGGHVADPTKYPFFAWLKIKWPYVDDDWNNDDDIFCGGSLIAPDVVMTAAHCIYGYDTIDVWVNATTRAPSDYEYFRKTIRKVSHPKYHLDGYGYDIGLLFLESPVTNVPLVQRNRNMSLPGDTRTIITAIGFGQLSTNGNTSKRLMEATFFSVPKPTCIKKLGTWAVHESEICAGEGKKGTCYGDSGGPIFLPKKKDDDELVQFGMSSRGSVYDCTGRPKKPEILTNVAYFAKWIDDTICKYSKSQPAEC
jgi:secreted trypsin-like serine protease